MEIKIIETLKKTGKVLTSLVKEDEFTKAAEKAFDCEINGETSFTSWGMPTKIPKKFNIGVIYGASGTGKSTLLNEFGSNIKYSWDDSKAIVSHFNTPDEAINKLSAVGLNSIPSWHKPYNVLSTGEKFRADLSRSIKNNAVIDEFTSVVDRNVAKSASVALSKYVKNNNIQNLVLATCHEDVLEWLEPDWVINTNTGEVYDGNFINGQTSISKYMKRNIVSGRCLKTITI